MKAFSGISLLRRGAIRWLAAAASAGTLVIAGTNGSAQPPAVETARTVEGKVQRMTTAPMGEIDGAVLDDGTWLHWPPHLGSRFTGVVKSGDRVRVSGRTEKGPAGDEHFEVDAVINTRSNARADNPDFAFGPARPPAGPRGRGPALQPPVADRREADSTTHVQGRVTRITTAPRGEVDGAVLADGTWLHWPPHLQNRFSTLVKEGDNVRAVGRNETGPEGETHFEIKSITNTTTNNTAENVDFASGPPAGPRGPRGRERRIPPHLRAGGRATAGNDAAQELSTREGKIQRLTTAPRGEVDGAVLDDGTWLHWPLHLQGQFNDVVKVGDRVRVMGQTETSPAGDTHFEVQSVTNILANRTAENPESIAALRPSSERTPQGDGASRERRLRELESQIEQMQRELGRLRLEK